MSLKLPVCFSLSFLDIVFLSIGDLPCNGEATAHLLLTKPEFSMARFLPMAISSRFKSMVKKDDIMITSTIEKVSKLSLYVG